jgi:hypothetical protein
MNRPQTRPRQTKRQPSKLLYCFATSASVTACALNWPPNSSRQPCATSNLSKRDADPVFELDRYRCYRPLRTRPDVSGRCARSDLAQALFPRGCARYRPCAEYRPHRQRLRSCAPDAVGNRARLAFRNQALQSLWRSSHKPDRLRRRPAYLAQPGAGIPAAILAHPGGALPPNRPV